MTYLSKKIRESLFLINSHIVQIQESVSIITLELEELENNHSTKSPKTEKQTKMETIAGDPKRRYDA